MSEQKKYFTRRESWECLKARGFPIAWTWYQTLCSPAVNAGPAAAGMWGQGKGRPLYTEEDVVQWAESRLRKPAAVKQII